MVLRPFLSVIGSDVLAAVRGANASRPCRPWVAVVASPRRATSMPHRVHLRSAPGETLVEELKPPDDTIAKAGRGQWRWSFDDAEEWSKDHHSSASQSR